MTPSIFREGGHALEFWTTESMWRGIGLVGKYAKKGDKGHLGKNTEKYKAELGRCSWWYSIL